jgi:hypothetical protein
MSRVVELVEREVYDGRERRGWYVPAKEGDGFDAFLADGEPLGRFTSEGAASRAILSGIRPTNGEGSP